MVVEIAERIGQTPDSISHHLVSIREAGLVATSRAGLYLIAKQCLAMPGQRVLDCEHCVLRLDVNRE